MRGAWIVEADEYEPTVGVSDSFHIQGEVRLAAPVIHKTCFRVRLAASVMFSCFELQKSKKIRLELFHFVKPRFSNMKSNTPAFVFMFENLSFRLRQALRSGRPET